MRWSSFQIRTCAARALRLSQGMAAGVCLTVAGIEFLASRLLQFARLFLSSFLLAGAAVSELLPNLDFLRKPEAFARISGENLEVFLSTGFRSFLLFTLLAAVLRFFWQLFFMAELQMGRLRWFSRNREREEAAPYEHLWGLFQSGKYRSALRSWLPMGLRLALLRLASQLLILLPLFYPRNFSSELFRGLSLEGRLNNAQYLQNLQTFLLMGLLACILSLLLFIYYFYKCYDYYFVGWLIADCPEIGAARAMELSRLMSRGEKSSLLAFNLSYAGWYLLASLALYFAPFFYALIDSYRLQALAELYAMKREDLAERGLLTMEELGYEKIHTAIEEAEEKAAAAAGEEQQTDEA